MTSEVTASQAQHTSRGLQGFSSSSSFVLHSSPHRSLGTAVMINEGTSSCVVLLVSITNRGRVPLIRGPAPATDTNVVKFRNNGEAGLGWTGLAEAGLGWACLPPHAMG